MNVRGSCIFGFMLLAFAIMTTGYADESPYEDNSESEGRDKSSTGMIVVANRGSGSISIINTRNNQLAGEVALPAAANPPEPMYVVHAPMAERVFIGDRANNRVVVFDDEAFEFEGAVAAGNGVFHMWADPGDNQLWVNNDIDNTTTVIDPVSLEVIHTVPMPLDLVELGGKPHDVILDPTGDFAYVTIVGIPGPADYVVKFSTETFQETARSAVGKDPHVSLTRRNKLLYVPCQNSDAVYVLKRRDLSMKNIINVPGAHGAGMPRNGRTFYTTNLPGGGVDGLFAIDTKNNTMIGNAVNTPFPVPHNIALSLNGRKLYVTHSGTTANKVSIYNIDRKTRLPIFQSELSVGINPFGLAFVR